jgi:mitochondrial fission protein ELM1
MAFFDKHVRILARYLRRPVTHGLAERLQPERVRLDVQDGAPPSAKPLVRIFLGTEAGHARAERVFLWSVQQHRDPARVYDIYLLKDLAGFDRRGWLTGFTNYRFAVPHFAGGVGRAIYNDVGQIYLADPGELFDTELAAYGFLALADRDTSVMLIDCARMAHVWTLAAAQCQRHQRLEAVAAGPGGRGPLDPVWHARDTEYVPHRSRLLHYAVMHTQPWQPFRQRYAYQRHPFAQMWLDLECAADAAGYQLFRATCPSTQYQAFFRQLHTRSAPANNGQHCPRVRPPDVPPAVRELITAAAARTLLLYGFGMDKDATAELTANLGGNAIAITPYDRALPAKMVQPLAEYDGVVCLQGLEGVPEEDVPWVIEEMFAQARRFVCLTVCQTAHVKRSQHSTYVLPRQRDLAWWRTRVEAASARYPALHWCLVVRTRQAMGRQTVQVREGGRRLHGTPTVWLLTDGSPGNTTQSVGLLQALGWPYERKELHFATRSRLQKRLPERKRGTRLGMDQQRSAALASPWPDLVVATGIRPARVARWIGTQSHGRTRLIQLGRKGGQVADWYDAVVSCLFYRLPPHPRRVEIVAPWTQVTPERLAQAHQRWGGLFEGAPQPRVALLVGGTSVVYRLDTETAQRLGEEVRTWAQKQGGSVFATTSRRTGPQATEALRRALGAECYVHEWRPGQPDNPYLGFLAAADVLVVTGDSESMLAEAVTTGKPLYIYPLPAKPLTRSKRLREWIVARAQHPRLTKRGTVRPQQGLAYLCARLIERGIVLPPNDPATLHQTLIQHGLARFFGDPLDIAPRPPHQALDDAARRVRALVGLG